MSDNGTPTREKELEEALIEYVERYGLTKKAKQVLSTAPPPSPLAGLNPAPPRPSAD